MNDKINNVTEEEAKKLEAYVNVLCSTFMSGYISAHNQIALQALKRTLNEEEVNKLTFTAKKTIDSFISMHVNNPTNKEIITKVLNIPVEKLQFPLFPEENKTDDVEEVKKK